MSLLIRWIVNTLALFLVVTIVPNFHYRDWITLAIAALVLGLLNAIVRPILFFLTLPITIVTLGLFLFVINAAMLLLTSWITGKLDVQFHVDGFWSALLGSVIITVVGILLNIVLPDKAEIK